MVFSKTQPKSYISRLFFYHRSDFGVILTGIALSSVLMHKNSPDTHIIVMHTIFINHHVMVPPKVKPL